RSLTWRRTGRRSPAVRASSSRPGRHRRRRDRRLLMSPPVLRLRDVSVSRDRSMLLRDVNWTVREDESWVIVGPNGAGKTTLLQLAGGLIEPSSGRAEVLGERVDQVSLADHADHADHADLAELRSRVGVASAAVAE